MVFFTGHTALQYWHRFLRLYGDRRNGNGPLPPFADFHRLPLETPRSKEALLESQAFCDSYPIEVMAPDRNHKCKSSLVANRIRDCEFPSRSFCRLSEGIHVVGVELLFLELAPEFDLVALAFLGCELASAYTYMEDIFEEGVDASGLKSCAPLTSRRSLLEYLDRCEGRHCIAKARLAASFVLDDAYSPMEICVGLLLTLPRRYGGFGLPKPDLNQEVEVDSEKGQGFRKRSIRFDMLWRKGRVALEYDSDSFHGSMDDLHDDSMRRNVARAMRFDVVTITSAEYQDVRCLERVARSIAKGIGHQMRPFGIGDLARISRTRDSLDSMRAKRLM